MSSTSYSPRAGSVADRVIHHLRTLAPRAELTSGALAAALGIDPAGLATSLAPAVEHRAVFRRTKGGHAKSPAFWSLHEHSASAAPPDDGKPVQRTIPANGAPPLPIVPPLFPRTAVQACRPEDRAMLETPAGAELLARTVEAMNGSQKPDDAAIGRTKADAPAEPLIGSNATLSLTGEVAIVAECGTVILFDAARGAQLRAFFARSA